MRNIFNQIKWAYQRVRYGYDDRIKWGFDSVIFTIQKPLREFCSDYLEDKERCELNQKRASILRQTLFLIEKLENESYEEAFDKTNLKNLAKYFGENIGWYWD